MTTQTRLDPVTFAVVRNALGAVAVKVHLAFERAGMHPLIYEAHDYAVAVYDDRFNLVSTANDSSLAAALDETVVGTVESIGDEEIHPGDLLVTSLPALHGIHPADVVLIDPVFVESRLVGFIVLREHVGDMGGAASLPMTTSDVFGEGTMLPPLKLVDRGLRNDAVIKILSANSRMPEMAVGNVLGGVAAVRSGSAALEALINKYGAETYYTVVDEILDHGERMMRAAIEAIPDGVYSAEGALDDNGVVPGVPVPLRLTVTIEGSDITMDTSGSAEEQAAPINSHLPMTKGALRMALKMLSLSESPRNGGEARVLTVVAPAGSMFNPSPTAGSYWAMRTSLHLSELMIPALAAAMPAGITGGRGSDHGSAHALLRHPITGEWVFSAYVGGTGGGAKRGADGPSAVYLNTNLRSVPVEVLERRDPTRRIRFELDQDSGGPGQWRGGLGVVNEQEFLAPGLGFMACFMTSGVEKILGIEGGLPPKRLYGVVFYAGSDHEIGPPNCRAANLPIVPGDRFVSWTAGGGGYGDPLKRDLDALAWDIKNEYVSVEAAEAYYGAVCDREGRLDRPATEARRSVLRRQGKRTS